MPGLLSSVFDGGGDDGASSSAQTSQGDADAGLDLSPGIALSHDAEASWTDADGTTHTYGSQNDVSLEVDVGAGLDAAGSLVTGSDDAG